MTKTMLIALGGLFFANLQIAQAGPRPQVAEIRERVFPCTLQWQPIEGHTPFSSMHKALMQERPNGVDMREYFKVKNQLLSSSKPPVKVKRVYITQQ